MIFVTVGHQMPFDRLIRAVDAWAGSTGRTDVFAQVGDASYQPQNLAAARHLSIEEFRSRMEGAKGVVAHAGTGTIIAALQLGKPLLVLPRRSSLGETRNDHQVSTARYFADAGHILAATDEHELTVRIDELEVFRPRASLNGHASLQLLDALRRFVAQTDPAGAAVAPR